MDFCFASLVLVGTIGVALVTVQMLTWRSTQGEVCATRAEIVAFRNNVFGALRFTHGSMEVLAQMIKVSPAERSLIELPPNPLFAPLPREGAAERQRSARVTSLDRITPDMPERLDALLRWAEAIDVAEEDIPLWLRSSDHPIGLQKLAVFVQSPNVLRPDPDAAPETFDPLWVRVLADLSRTRPDATFTEIADEFNRRAALEEGAARPPSKPRK
jgi:hypothetical protein